jgi:hypothetical protein
MKEVFYDSDEQRRHIESKERERIAAARTTGDVSRLPGWHPLHRCGMFCDGQDGQNSECATERSYGPPAWFVREEQPEVYKAQRLAAIEAELESLRAQVAEVARVDKRGKSFGQPAPALVQVLREDLDAAVKRADTAELEVARLRKEGWPGTVHAVDEAFHKVVLTERDAAHKREAHWQERAVEAERERDAAGQALLSISKIPMVQQYAGVGDQSVHDAVVAITGALICARRDLAEAKEALATERVLSTRKTKLLQELRPLVRSVPAFSFENHATYEREIDAVAAGRPYP